MFGHNEGSQQTDQNQTDAAAASAPSVSTFTPPPAINPTTASPTTDAANNSMALPGSPGLPGNLTSSTPSVDESAAPAPATSAPSTEPAGLTASPNDLMRIKQEALQKLSPLVEHLDQTPEERFRTTMMMIQATDDSSMIESAYEAAQQIVDEKLKAQAFLDVVNEINYFAQQQKEEL